MQSGGTARGFVPAALRAGVLALVCTLSAALPAFAEDDLVRRIKAEVLRELRDDKWLAEQIELGIQRYVDRMKALQQAAVAQELRKADEKARAVRRPLHGRDAIRGQVEAEVSLIEYSDFECPYCKSFHQTAGELLKVFDGRVNWVYRHFPLESHNPAAQKQARAAECARQLGGAAAFWPYADAIFARTASGGKGFAEARLVPLARELGLDGKRFHRCLTSASSAARVKEDVEDAQKLGIAGTPTTIILNNRTGEARLAVGTPSIAELYARIEYLLRVQP